MAVLRQREAVSEYPSLSREADDRVQVLDADGRVREGATVPEIGDDELLAMYEEMRLARELDERAVTLQRQGNLGTYPPMAGQEGSQIASTHALAEADWIVYQYREHGAVVARGIGPELLGYWRGHELGNEWLAERNVFPLNISIGSQIPHATGMAWAMKLRGDDRAVICHFGDGATSEGDFHEGLNFAGVFDVPAVFFCNNNQWAISVPRERQTASETLALKAAAYGFEGVQVDGMDPLAVYQVTREALRKAKSDGERPRPTLIEAVQYRFGAHTTADDPERYREAEDLERWKRKDPIPRFETFLRERGLLDDEAVAAVQERIEAALDEAIEEAEAVQRPHPDELFEHVYAEPTPRLREQKEYLRALRDRHSDDELLE